MHFYNLHFIHHPSGHIMWSSKNLQKSHLPCSSCWHFASMPVASLMASFKRLRLKPLMVGRRPFPFWVPAHFQMLWCYVSFWAGHLICEVCLVCCLEVPQTSPGEKTYQQIEVLVTKTLHSNHVQRDCFGLTQMLGLLSFYNSLMLQHDCWILPPPISPKAPKWPICCKLQLAKLTTQAMYCHVQGPLVT